MGYSQRDPAWAGKTLGGGPDTIGADGCYLTSYAMLATWMNHPVHPDQLNEVFKGGIFGSEGNCAECLPDDALQRAFPEMAKLSAIYRYPGSPADLSKLSNSSPTDFVVVELQLGPESFHFAPVIDGTKGRASTIQDPWPYPTYVRPISDYGDPATVIVKIIHYTWLNPPAPPPAPPAEGYWPGWDIARGVAMLNPTDGVKLDGFGGLHPIGGVGELSGYAYWKGWDIARDIALNPDHSSGYVLDGWGGVHPFAIGSNPVPPTPALGAYWPKWDIARRIVVTEQGKGFVMDAWGGRHSFG